MTMTKKNWTIENGVLPDELRAELKKFLERETGFSKGETPRPPWVEFPDYNRTSMGWRMGAGEDYMLDFRAWFRALDGQRKSEYVSANPEPDGWFGFFDYIKGQ